MVKAIIFDCFGVLYTPAKDQFMEQVPSDEALRNELLDLGRQADYGLITQEEFTQTAAALTHLPAEIVRRQAMAGHVRNQQLLDYISTLRPTYKIGVLSNIARHTMDNFFTLKERQEFFDIVVCSSDIGMIKPHPSIFEYTCHQLGVDTSEAIMIDDTLVNCAGAIEAGMQAIEYTTFTEVTQKLETLLKQ